MNKGKGLEEVFLPRCFPPWVEELEREHCGYDLCSMMEKRLEETDCSDNHARLSIQKKYLDAHILPFLTKDEKMLANLLNPVSKKKKAVGREHGGLLVQVFTRNRWCFTLALTHWDANGATVLKGKEWKMARVFN